MKPPPGITDWTRPKFRRWVGGKVEGHTDELGRLLRIVSQQNALISELRRRQEILTQKVDVITRPGSTDYAVRLAEMANESAD